MVRNPAPYALEQWRSDPTIVQVIVSNPTSSPKRFVLDLYLQNQNTRQEAQTNEMHPCMPVFELAPGQTRTLNGPELICEASLVYDATIRTQLITTGAIPEGEYRFCVRALDADNRSRELTSSGTLCASTQVQWYDPPAIVRPVARDRGLRCDQAIVLNWQPPIPVPAPGSVVYRVRVVGMFEGQLPRQALEAATPSETVVDAEVSTTSYTIGANDPVILDLLRRPAPRCIGFAWQVQALQATTRQPFPTRGGTQGKSTIETFTVECPGSTANMPEAPTPEQQLEQANQTFRSTVASAMQEAAKLAGVTITTDNFVAILLDDGSSVVVNAGIAGVENLTLEQLAKGADVLFVFLRPPQGSGLPSGFYTVRFFQTPGTTQWKAQFRNLEGQVALETDAEVGLGDLAREIPKLTGGFGCDFDKGECWIKIDIRWKNAYAKASVPLGTGGPDPTPLPAAGQVIAQATAKFYEAARGIINTVKTNTYRQVIIGSRDDYLVVHTVFRGVELYIDDLAKGHDVLFCYFRTPQSSDLPTGFYTVRIAQSATGEWVARFVDAKGNTVKEVPATVKLITDIQTGIQAAFLQQVESTTREIEMLRALPEERLAEYAAFLQQVESTTREIEMLRALPEERLAEYLVPEEEVVAEFQRLFPPAERTETQSRISAGAPYRPAVPEKGQEEDPPIKRLTGYEIKPEDVREGRITPEGEKRILEHLRMKIAKERLEAVREVYRRGVPYILVDHGKITVKLAFYASPQESSQTQERSAKPAAEVFSALRPEAVPLKIEARVVNEKNVEALGREAGAIGEIEISFKVDLR
jgi:hypothetical protein